MINETTLQPVLVQMSSFQLFIKLDSNLALLESSNFTYALDILFKCYEMLNIAYPIEKALLYKFFEIIFQIDDHKNLALLELDSNILRFVGPE